MSANIPAKACFLPNLLGLYDKLDESPGAIAEWILPLVLAGELNHVVWLKSSFSNQFDSGSYQFHVGASKNKMNSKVKAELTTINSFYSLSEDALIKVTSKRITRDASIFARAYSQIGLVTLA